MSVIPEKREDLIDLGYEYTGDGRCRDCQEAVEWWVKPNGKRVPLSVHEEGSGVGQEHTGRVGFFRRLHFNECKEKSSR